MSPRVTGIMLVNGRHAMVARAVQSFMAQDYPNKYLLVWDTGESKYAPPFVYDPHGIEVWHRKAGATVGELRNDAIAESRGEIIVTFDSDDVSNARRISEQVSLLTSSGADAVGYSDLLFWDTRARLIDPELHDTDSFEPANESWLYSRPTRLNVPGTTLMYKRSVWERKPFPHLPEVGNPASQGEDVVWQAGLKVVATTSIGTKAADDEFFYQPRMIASVHSGNTMAAGYSHMGHVEEFVRTPEWDSFCERTMKL